MRGWTYEDVPTVVEAGRDPTIPMLTTLPRSSGERDAREFVARQRWYARAKLAYPFAICLPHPGNPVSVGAACLWPVPFDPARALLGLWVLDRWRRNGIGTAALVALAGWAVSSLGIERLELQVDPSDPAGRKAAEHAGFGAVGMVRRVGRSDEARPERLLFALVRSA
nr:GNAT family N-acetyltransferase [Pseudonocardia spinosispora]